MFRVCPHFFFCLLFFTNSAVYSHSESNFAGLLSFRQEVPDGLILEFSPIEPKVQRLEIDGEIYHSISLPKFGQIAKPGYPNLPSISFFIAIPRNSRVTAAVLERDGYEVSDINPLPEPIQDIEPISGKAVLDYKKDAVYRSNGFWPAQDAEAKPAGVWHGLHLARIQLNPIQYNGVTGELRVATRMRVHVRFDKAVPTASKQPERMKLLPQNLILNAGMSYRALTDFESVAWQPTDAQYWKLYVEKEGIFRLSYDDLVAAGINPGLFDASKIKIVNKGNEIPVWIAGPPGPTLTPANRLFFVGQRNQADSSFYDVYTDANVYWLTFEGEAGLRYRDEALSNQVQSADFYWDSRHFEEENIFHRSNLTTPVDDDEGWIWRYFFAGDEETIPFPVYGLYDQAGPCTLRVALRGTTTDPVNPDHHILLKVNNVVILDTFFDNREQFNVSIPFSTEILQDGLNEIHLQLVGDTGAQVNQVYLDWIELVLPRRHSATQDLLHFNATKAGDSKYRLTNFTNREIIALSPSSNRVWQLQSENFSVYSVESAGFDDGSFVQFTFDDSTHSFKNRGHTLATIDAQNARPEFLNFDTFSSADEANRMAGFIEGLPDSTLVLVGIADEGSFSMTERAQQALESLGSALTRQVGGRDSWALIGRKGAAIGQAKEALSKQLAGTAAIEDTITDQYALRFAVTLEDNALSGARYYVAGESGFKSVSEIRDVGENDLRTVTQGADYIIITHSDFNQAADALAEYRSRKDGYRTSVVDVENIYDQFNFGIEHPKAIKDFLNHAYLHWPDPAPAFVLLLGDASWDPKQLLADAVKQSFIPMYGSLASDNWYVTFDGNDDVLPEMFIGRLPVETPEQAEIVIQKIMKYESLPYASWNKKILFLSGGANSNEQNVFSTQSDTLISHYVEPAPFAARSIQFNKTSTQSISHTFIFRVADIIREGVLWVNFLGHGGSSIWDINIEGPEQWQNTDVFPFMTGMSCHSARFANPILNSLSEDYVLSPIGAAAYWGSAGFGYISQDFFLLDGLFKAIAADTIRTLGEATTLAKMSLWQKLGDQPRNRFVIEQYVLIGDPGMKIRIPEKPELAIEPEDVMFDDDLFLVSDSSSAVEVIINNFGLAPLDSVGLQTSTRKSDNQLVNIDEMKFPPVFISDTLSTRWRVPATAGNYEVTFAVDPDDIIPEEVETNNSVTIASHVFSSDLSLLRPLNYGTTVDASPKLVTSNSRLSERDVSYFFEIDTSRTFTSPLFQESGSVSEKDLVTIWQPALQIPAVYFWRVRTFDGENFGPWANASFIYDLNTSASWIQRNTGQFSGNTLDNTSAMDNKVSLNPFKVLFDVESAGFLEGSHAFILRNGELLNPNTRGHNLVVIDETDGGVLSVQSFDTFFDPNQSNAMADYIEQWPNGKIIIAAIRDEGSFSMTESAYQALESLGSQFTRQVGTRDSWAIFGRKGAATGAVPEAWKVSGEGPAVLADSLIRVFKDGKVISPAVGPALSWRTASFNALSDTENGDIRFQVLGLNRKTGRTDTLRRNLTQVGQVSLTGIDPAIYSSIQLYAVMRSDDGLETPKLNEWAVDFERPSDLVVARNSLQSVRDTLEAGEEVKLSIKLGNFGFSPSGAFAVRVMAAEQGGSALEVSRVAVDDLAPNEAKDLEASFVADNFSGRVRLTAELDPDDEIIEILETNNSVVRQIWVGQDTLSPNINVTFDGNPLAEDDFVSSSPTIVIEIRDSNSFASQDTQRVTILLDESKVTYGISPGQAQLLPQQNAKDKSLKALVVFMPHLTPTEHQLQVVVRDGSNNLGYFDVHFFVSDAFALANVMNYPNPFSNSTEFTYILTQPADYMRLKVYTVSGRLILTLDDLPASAGYNQFMWDGRDQDGDTLANGVYLYKLIARRDSQQTETIEKFVVMR